MSFPTRKVSSLLSLAVLACIAPSAWAVEPLDTFSVSVGSYVNTFDTTIRADGESSDGTEINLKRDLGLDNDNALGFVGLTWRPFEHHEFGFAYYRNDSSSTKVLEREIEFDGEIYEASATVNADFSLDTYEAYYVWWAASHEKWALGPRLGLIWYKADLGIDLQASTGGGEIDESRNSSVSADLPAPTIGGSWRWTPAEDWRISADIGYFTADINGIDADITFGRAGVEWFPWEKVGFSLNYVISNIEADASKNNFNGHAEFENSGLRIGVGYRF